MVCEQVIQVARQADFDSEAMEREKGRLRLKREHILKQHREGYIEDEEMEEEMASVELALRALEFHTEARLRSLFHILLIYYSIRDELSI
ncbi:hypothetical protein KSB_29670 [Ktedonobacter robiniae]|uniref:Uncharacterized protein n=1 Tax=Ktedonobacter robiniae TaxID=2778365 RepID=A0ABQ3UQ55_9CHLR|nr:hypothetical protein KSB_29670 [Ktedonobacter robiniae]